MTSESAMTDPAAAAYAADWLVPVGAPPIRHGAVVVQDGRVDWMGRAADVPAEFGVPVIERGVIVPGLVNAHTHLQYTGFVEVGARRYDGFEHWSDVFGEAYDAVDPASWAPAARQGARMGLQSGTTVFAEIVTDHPARGALADTGAGGIEYLESIAERNDTWAAGGRDSFLAWLEAPASVRVGISPHAPYSLDGSVITDLVRIAAERGVRVHSHLGESAVEADLYRHGDDRVLGPYGDLRDEFELVRIGGTGVATAEYADGLGLLGPTTHVAHAIYLERGERDLLRARGTQVALCPRSNTVIGLDDAPVAAYLAEGHEISVGTDSLASSPSLDLMADVRELTRLARSQGYRHDDLHERVLRAATLGGAIAMGLDASGYGVLAVGGPADLARFDVAVGDRDPREAVIADGAGRCVLTVCAGTVRHSGARTDADHTYRRPAAARG